MSHHIHTTVRALRFERFGTPGAPDLGEPSCTEIRTAEAERRAGTSDVDAHERVAVDSRSKFVRASGD